MYSRCEATVAGWPVGRNASDAPFDLRVLNDNGTERSSSTLEYYLSLEGE
jgi:hypothetical protein